MRLLRDPQAMVLVAACEAFLEGRYAEMVEEAGVPAPAWAWMNLLAHGTEEEVRAARAYVAGEMLDAIDEGRTTLAELQREVLVPVELDVLACRCSAVWTPGQLAAGLLRIIPSPERRHRR